MLEGCLRLLHPYMPFVTEALWQYLPHQGEALIIAPWPQAGAVDEEAESLMGSLMELIRVIRNARSEYNVEPARRIAAIVVAEERAAFLEGQRAVLEALARVDGGRLTIVKHLEEIPQHALALVVSDYACYLPLAAMLDLDRERERLQKELVDLQREVARAEKLLANEGFVSKAPAAVVQREREKLEDLRGRVVRLNERLASLE
ncbi:MAG: class I tRNA ligase family protein [Chloroflexi bacterium]|nr:class I tRNA ligase family protein [Chloroflexota bacterium]